MQLIDEDERLSCVVAGARIYYRRVPSYVQQRLEAQHSKRGAVDQRAVVDGVLAYAVLDWDGVRDKHGRPVPYSPDLLKNVPESAKADLITKLYESDPTESLLGNSAAG